MTESYTAGVSTAPEFIRLDDLGGTPRPETICFECSHQHMTAGAWRDQAPTATAINRDVARGRAATETNPQDARRRPFATLESWGQ
jgi:hypothetical protein